ncbi:MAG: hypothetical protein KIT75_03490 [Planctomycetota bacterium]|nr:hypothetical protein [Planctomycetota bacterium]
MNLKAIGSAKSDQLLENISDVRIEALGKRRARVIAATGAGREAEVDTDLASRLVSHELRPFSRRVRVQFAASGTPSAMVDTQSETYMAKPYPFTGSTQNADQPEDDGVLIIDQIALEFDGDLKLNTLKSLRNNYGLKIHYPGGKKPRVWNLADVMEAGNLSAIDAGVDNATNPNESVVAGTHHHARPPVALLRFEPDEYLVVRPKESQVKIELVRLPWQTSAPTLTGETASLYWFATFRGERLASNHEKF